MWSTFNGFGQLNDSRVSKVFAPTTFAEGVSNKSLSQTIIHDMALSVSHGRRPENPRGAVRAGWGIRAFTAQMKSEVNGQIDHVCDK